MLDLDEALCDIILTALMDKRIEFSKTDFMQICSFLMLTDNFPFQGRSLSEFAVRTREESGYFDMVIRIDLDSLWLGKTGVNYTPAGPEFYEIEYELFTHERVLERYLDGQEPLNLDKLYQWCNETKALQQRPGVSYALERTRGLIN